MFGRRSRIKFIRLQCLCLSYTLLRLQCHFRSCFIALRSQFMSQKNYSVMPAPVLGVRIRIVAMRILLLALYLIGAPAPVLTAPDPYRSYIL
jgi:hypothetical protein